MLKVLAVILLLSIFVQDIKYRMVSVWMFPLLAAVLLGLGGMQRGWLIFSSLVYNLLFVSVQLGLLSIWFYFKHKQWINITRHLLGWGDIFFLACLACYLPILGYVFFYVASLITALIIGAVIGGRTDTGIRKTIPLAGLQALLLTLVLGAGWLWPQTDLTNDQWLWSILA